MPVQHRAPARRAARWRSGQRRASRPGRRGAGGPGAAGRGGPAGGAAGPGGGRRVVEPTAGSVIRPRGRGRRPGWVAVSPDGVVRDRLGGAGSHPSDPCPCTRAPPLARSPGRRRCLRALHFRGHRVQHRAGSPKVSRRVSPVSCRMVVTEAAQTRRDERARTALGAAAGLGGGPTGLPDRRVRVHRGRPNPTARPGGDRAGRTGRRPAGRPDRRAGRGQPRSRSTWSALEHNVGLGPALDAGLAACRHPVVARMDADDISLPHRFAVQLPIIESGVDIVGSGLVEFADDPDDVVGTRTPPIEPADIRERARFAIPFNHPTVVYRRDLVLVRRRLHRLRPDGGLPALGQAHPGRRPGGQRGRAAGQVPGRGRGPTRAAAGWPQLRAELAVQRRFRRLGFTTRRPVPAQRAGARRLPAGARADPAIGVSTPDRNLSDRDERSVRQWHHPRQSLPRRGPASAGGAR